MRVAFKILLASILAVTVSAVAEAQDATQQDATQKAPPTCLYRDAKYGPGAVICVAPGYGQKCGSNGWLDPSDYKTACANAQIPVPGVPPNQCIYHDVHYAIGAAICVAPRYGQRCTPEGTWTLISTNEHFDKACENAQIPAPTYPAAPAASTKSQ